MPSSLNGKYLRKERDADNQARPLESAWGPPHPPKILWTLVHKRLKMWLEFLTIRCKFCVLLRCQALDTEVSKRSSTKLCQTERGNWRWCKPNKVVPHSECQWNRQNYVAGFPVPKPHFKLAMAWRRVAISGNRPTSLIDTLSIVDDLVRFSYCLWLRFQ